MRKEKRGFSKKWLRVNQIEEIYIYTKEQKFLSKVY